MILIGKIKKLLFRDLEAEEVKYILVNTLNTFSITNWGLAADTGYKEVFTFTNKKDASLFLRNKVSRDDREFYILFEKSK